MRIYPAIRAQMGDWRYYIVRMKMREIAHEVQLAHDIYEDNTLSDAVQRSLGDRRVKKEIVGYLARRPDRFFSSIVVAAMDGNPIWHPVEMDESIVPNIFSQTASLSESFGVLCFGDEPKYYALDGQHRVAAIKLLANGQADFDPPEKFDEDLLSVIVVLREEHDVPKGEWLRRYRRLFSSLNRYAKPTDRDTNIIMDEDDLFAILTRQLITDHEFFRTPGRERESFRVLTQGKSLKENSPHFTTLQVLYAVNEILLKTREREQKGWFSEEQEIDKQIRPEEEDIEACYAELSDYWDAILGVIPNLRKPPQEMKQHTADEPNSGDVFDHLLFWPIGQELFARIVRNLLDDRFPNGGCGSVGEMQQALNSLQDIPWELHGVPWRNLLLVRPSEDARWRMRSEDRKQAIDVARRILRWILSIDSLDEDDETTLRGDYQEWLYGDFSEKEIDGMWDEIKEIRGSIVSEE